MLPSNPGFVTYEHQQELPPNLQLYDQLVLAHASGDRKKMETEAADFIEGKGAYEGAYLASLAAAEAPFSSFSLLLRKMRRHPPTGNRSSCLSWMQEQYPDIYNAMGEMELTKNKLLLERAWQSHFANTICSEQKTENLSHLLIVHHFLQIIHNTSIHWHSETLGKLLAAVIELPVAVFPLPVMTAEN